MPCAKLFASEIASACGILILECLLRYAKDHSSALILAALCLSSSIDTLGEWCERIKPKFQMMDYIHLLYAVATVVCSSFEFMKVSGYKALGHFEDVPFCIAIAIPSLVILEILVLLIKKMITKGRPAGPNGVGDGLRDSTSILIDNSNTNRTLGGATSGAIGEVTRTWTTEAANGASLSTLILTTTTGLTFTLTASHASAY